MNEAAISPDQWVLVDWGPYRLSATIAFTWLVVVGMAVATKLASGRLVSTPRPPRWQSALELVFEGMRRQMREIAQHDADRYVPFVGTLFLFIAVSNILTVVPGFAAPTASLSTTTALALLVFLAVPAYGIAERGFLGYLRRYVRPTPLMLPFNVLGELTRTLALAVRLFGNVMSGAKIVAILLAVAPLVFPVALQLLGLLTGLVQAYIFAVLAMVYIAAASRRPDSAAHGGSPVEESSPHG
jgi:F-type H+-transporting ATPase subunit a